MPFKVAVGSSIRVLASVSNITCSSTHRRVTGYILMIDFLI
jgi:hypothetical protein